MWPLVALNGIKWPQLFSTTHENAASPRESGVFDIVIINVLIELLLIEEIDVCIP
jgi:hypothetical protein